MGLKLGRTVGNMPHVLMMQKSVFTRNLPCLRFYACGDTLYTQPQIVFFCKSAHIYIFSTNASMYNMIVLLYTYTYLCVDYIVILPHAVS